ncbi:hypothetical protein [Nocardia australiensis]|uniref:hypothetical protein n=1 Tax=Nocardia australiensis TaxID=2887191 RepID=UPI001D13CF64|nr:hypothetical protein [Nocardia australiensis]
MTLEAVSGDLYGLDPGQFVAARAERVKAAKAAGDKQLAAAIAKLRKPTLTAWTVNLLARAEPGDVEALLRLGTALRTAQRQLSGTQLRSLSAQRQQLVNALAKRAATLAAEHGHPVGEAVLREVSQTLTAALADTEVAERVRAGTLTTAATYDGFGPAGPILAAVDDVDTPPPPTTGPDEEARRELADALDALESARTAIDSAQAAAQYAANQLADSESHLTALREELAHAEQQKQFARAADHDARDRLRSAQKQLDRVERCVQRARERVVDQ